ncbi:MAG: HAD family hydrolase [Erysipelotrichia bacterium]|nr:HAD family hydrolase [Erysipelotrichia bacterium]
MKDLKTIFWDWNGTLLDDVRECIDIINISLQKRSLKKLSLDDYLEKFTFPIKQYYENVGFDFSVESYEEAGREYIDAYSTRMFECRLHQGVLAALKGFKQMGMQQFILSALHDGSLQQCIEHYALGGYFDKVCGLSDSYAHSKIELGRQLILQAGCEKELSLMVGDTVHDFETASAMGIRCVLIAAGHNSKDRLLACGVPVYENIEEFAGHLLAK